MVAASPGMAKTVLSEAELPPAEMIFGTTAKMEAVRLQVEAAVSGSIPLLLRGECGSGKETIAKLLHLKSLCSRSPFVKINCSALPCELIESEYCGNERGASVSGNGSRPGRPRTSRLGTLFFDEIGALDAEAQENLLQILQDSRFSRVDGQPERSMETRVISSTNHDLENHAGTGAFRKDLLDRLDGMSITLPPLRERREDIPALIDYLCARYNRIFNRHTPPLSASAIHVLQNYQWPGNIRELENLLRRYVITGQEKLAVSDVSGHSEFVLIPDYSKRSDLALKSITRQVKRELERKLILRALEDNQWNRKKAASTLKISYRALLYKLRGSGIPSLRSTSSQPRTASFYGKALGSGPGLDGGGSPPKLD